MKITINKSAKRVLSIALALAMVIGTLFTANTGVTYIASAATDPIAEGTIDLLEFGSYLTDMGSSRTDADTILADNGEKGTSWDDAIIIDSAEEFFYLSKFAGNETIGKYYKVADGIAGFNLSTNNLDINGTLADNLDTIKGSGKNFSGGTPGFQGHFDGNGVTVYGAWTSHTNVSAYAGLFSCTKGNVTIKNVNVKFASFTATTAAGGIVGYYLGEGNYTNNTTLTIENCSVTDSHLEVTGTGWATGLGAIVGRVECPSGYTDTNDENSNGKIDDYVYVNNKINVTSCYVNLDETYFISSGEDGTESSGERLCHGGVAGVLGSNALTVSDCIVLGVTPYATSECTAYNDVQHSGLESHFTNVYTDTGSLQAAIGGSSLGTRNFTNRIFILTPEQMQGAAAVNNMNLAWFSGWLPGEEGEYPTINQTGEESNVSFWTGAAASEFAGGTGTKDDPFIIKTADQLYLALTKITATTSTEGDLAVGTAESVAGGTQTSRILQQSSTDVYVPVYEPYYYKVDDSVEAFYLNNVYGNETLDGAKAMGASSTKKEWKPGKSFVGHLDGNSVTIYGMYCAGGQGLVYKLDGSATVKNFNFNACYSTGSGNSALVTTNLGSHLNDSTLLTVANISVRNSYIATTRNITLSDSNSDGYYEHGPGAAGIVSTSNTCENLTIANCLYDGRSCERAIGESSEATVNMIGGIISGGYNMNNVELNGCVSLGAPAVDEVYVNGKEVFYNRYDYNQGYSVYLYNSYSDVTSQVVANYPDKYEKLADIVRLTHKNAYEMYDMPKLSWSNWSLVKVEDGRTIPMPVVNTSTGNDLGSYVSRLDADNDKHSSVGPYKNGTATNPLVYTLDGSGTKDDPYLIKTDIQLARAIATGGMNLNVKLYYKLANDIDISSGAWINQAEVTYGNIKYYYTPFAGELDGDGHTITGLNAGDSESAGLIPVLNGGTVKNLHLRDVTVVSSDFAGALVGWMHGGSVTNCSVENAVVSSKGGYSDAEIYIVYNDDPSVPDEYGTITDCYYIGKDKNGEDTAVYITDHNADDGVVMKTAAEISAEIFAGNTEYTSKWYIGGKEGSMPRLINQAQGAKCVDVDGDGIGNEYTPNDLVSLRNNLLRKSAYKYIYGDVSRNGTVNIADLAVLQRTIAEDYGTDVSDSFFANVQAGNIKIYYGENDNYDAARKVELYLENLTGTDVTKVVSSSKGTVTGANSDANKVYLHANDQIGTPDGELEIIVGNIDNYSAYNTNTVATGANTYAVTYDSTNKVVWLQGENFTAVEQAVLDFIAGSDYKTSTVFECGSKELADEKKPITVKLDTDYDGVIDADTTLYYAWGDEFNDDQLNTDNWTHNTQQSEGQNGELSAYLNQEVAPVKDIGKVIVVKDGKLSMKRGYDSTLGTSTNGTVPLEVDGGEYNGYNQWDSTTNSYINAIDTDGSDQYFSSGKITTSRGMLYKQGYIEFAGQLPADGHAFPAWWLMGRPSQSASNNGYDDSLYSKVYKLNSNWNGSDTWDKTNLDTYKYQIPTAIYEIDMIEVMQHGSRYGAIKEKSSGIEGWFASSYQNKSTTYSNSKAVGWYMINSTIHKWWNNGVTKDNLLYIHDWDNYQVMNEEGITNSAFSTTSTAGTWIHNIGSTELDFGTPTTGSSNVYYSGATTGTTAENARNKLQAYRKYGFSWNTNGVNGFEATLYVYDKDATGATTVTTVPIASGMSELNAFKDGNGKTEANGAIGNAGAADVYSDAKVFNQYMFVLLDNKFYSANPAGYNAGDSSYKNKVVQFTDLLTAAGLTSLEVDYVRVYQKDGERDIVTQETENFNNNNHFGYN